jgi:predicted transcriptional regulator
MPPHTITLTGPQEDILEALVEKWRKKPGQGNVNGDMVLDKIVTQALQEEEGEVEAAMSQLSAVAKTVPKVVRDKMLEGLTAQQQARLRHLLD